MTEPEIPACMASIPVETALRLAAFAVFCARTRDVERLRNHVERELAECLCSKDFLSVLRFIYGAQAEDAPAA